MPAVFIFFVSLRMEKIELHMAPLQGYTEVEYRRAWRDVYGCSDVIMYTPFVRVEHGEVCRRTMRDVMSELNAPEGVVPQIIVGSEAEFDMLSKTLKDSGFSRIDINMGCPFTPQLKRSRGAASVCNIPLIRSIASRIEADSDCVYSVKMRAGLTDHSQWREAVEILNDVPLSHITMHPRIASDQYRGKARHDVFAEFASLCRHRTVYNGDISEPSQIHNIIEEIGGVHGVMAGRGLLSRPSLFAEYTQGAEWTETERVQAILRLHSRYRMLLEKRIQGGDHQLLGKLKPFWEYLENSIGRKSWKAIHKASGLAAYEAAVRTIVCGE